MFLSQKSKSDLEKNDQTCGKWELKPQKLA